MKGLENQAKHLDKAAVKLANALVAAVKKALGIHSPSRVFQGLGDNVVKGLQIGLSDTYVKRSGEQLATSLQKGFGQPALEAYASQTAAPGGGQPLRITLSAQQISQLQRGREIRGRPGRVQVRRRKEQVVSQQFKTADVVRLEVETDPAGLVNLVQNPSGELGGWAG